MKAANPGQSEVAANPMPPTIHHFNYKSILIIQQLYSKARGKIDHAKRIFLKAMDEIFLILMIIITDDWLPAYHTAGPP